MNQTQIEIENEYKGNCFKAKRHVPSHLYGAGATENSARKTVRCREFRPCKRTECTPCQERRRGYFVEAGRLLAEEKGLNLHATISWPLTDNECSWERLLNLSSMLSRKLTGRIGPFIRTLAIGKSDTPHVHYLINEDFKDRFYEIVKKNSPAGCRVFIDSELVKDVSGLLDYFFKMNFSPTVNDPRKVKGMRLISGSRGRITYSYPKTPHWKMLKELKESLEN